MKALEISLKMLKLFFDTGNSMIKFGNESKNVNGLIGQPFFGQKPLSDEQKAKQAAAKKFRDNLNAQKLSLEVAMLRDSAYKQNIRSSSLTLAQLPAPQGTLEKLNDTNAESKLAELKNETKALKMQYSKLQDQNQMLLDQIGALKELVVKQNPTMLHSVGLKSSKNPTAPSVALKVKAKA